MLSYNRDAHDIYRRSFQIIREEADLSRIPPDLEQVAIRVAHACGMPDIVDDLLFSADAGQAGRSAVESGAAILCDSRMVADGVIRSRFPGGNSILCALDDPAVPELARQRNTTRSAAAVEVWRPLLPGSVVVIGNAPTALFHLLELLDEGVPKPALIIGFPVGYVGAAESKAELTADSRGVPFIAVKGRRGGSAMAAAAVNALGNGHP